MIEDNYTFTSVDGTQVFVYTWKPDKKPVAVLQIAHGAVEHAKRYEHFAKYLTEQGIAVYANDIRGHGKTARSIENLSYFSDEDNGWELAINDMHTITDTIKEENPGVPVFLMGHSMGSLLTRDYISDYGKDIKGAIISGTNTSSAIMRFTGSTLSKIILKVNGRKHNSKFLHNLMFGPLGSNIKDARTDCDFISCDEKVVDEYIADKYCGHQVTPEFIREFVKGLSKAGKKQTFEKTPKDLPIFMLSGEFDPVGGKDLAEVYDVFEAYKKAGVHDIDLKI